MKLPALRRLAFGVVLGALVPTVTLAATAPRWVREAIPATAPNPPPDAAAVILYDRTELRLGSDLNVQVHRRRIARILRAEGVAPATMRLKLEPGGALTHIQSWTISPEGLRGSADRSELVETQVSSEGYSDVRLLSLPAPGATPGDLVAFEASWEEREPFPMHQWLPQPENLPVLRAELDIELPSGWSAAIQGYHVAPPLPASQASRVQLALSDLPSLPDESLRPLDSALLPRVLVRYLDRDRKLALDDWNRIAGFYARMTRDPSSATECPAELSASSTQGAPSQRLAELARIVQQRVRYVAIEMGMQRWIPDPARATWQRRYGDCKDKGALLVSALASSGIEARLVLVCTRDRWEVDPASPDLFQFNHAIVAIAWPGDAAPAAATATGRSGRRWTFFDPTDDETPLGAISDQLGGTWGVIADPAEGLVQLPESTPFELTREVRARLGRDGDLTGRITLWADGAAGSALLARFGPFSSAERRHRASEFLLARWPQATLDSCHLAVSTRGGDRRGVHMYFRLPAVARPMGRAWLATPKLLSGWSLPPPRDSVRTMPLRLGVRGVIEENWEVALPEGVEAEQRKPVLWKDAIAEYSMTTGGSPGMLTLSRRLNLRTREIPADQFGQGRSLWRAVYSGDHPSILLTQR